MRKPKRHKKVKNTIFRSVGYVDWSKFAPYTAKNKLVGENTVTRVHDSGSYSLGSKDTLSEFYVSFNSLQ